MLGGKPWSAWISEYAESHQHPLNRATHFVGIPLIALSLPLFVVALFVSGFWPMPLAMFVVGWILQFVGHAIRGQGARVFPGLALPVCGPEVVGREDPREGD